jgi:hypothetical protein
MACSLALQMEAGTVSISKYLDIPTRRLAAPRTGAEFTQLHDEYRQLRDAGLARTAPRARLGRRPVRRLRPQG